MNFIFFYNLSFFLNSNSPSYLSGSKRPTQTPPGISQHLEENEDGGADGQMENLPCPTGYCFLSEEPLPKRSIS